MGRNELVCSFRFALPRPWFADRAYLLCLSPSCSENREGIDRIVEVLLENESMTGDEFRAILSQYATIPQENLDAVARQKQPDIELQLA